MANNQPHKSEIARFREQQALEEQSALLGLFGAAQVASHAAIARRWDQHAGEIARLFNDGKDEEAMNLWESLHTL